MRTRLLEGGGTLNGSMLRAGLVGELSLVVAPIADGRVGMPSVIDVNGEAFAPRALSLEQVEQREAGVPWLRYRVLPPSQKA